MCLLWSMPPPGGSGREFLMQATERADGSRVSAELRLRRLAPGIEVRPIRDGRQRGTMLRWSDRTRSRGAIMSLTGSGAGVEMGYAPLLASLGYDVPSLACFNYEDLTPMLADIPLEYFAEGSSGCVASAARATWT